ncbi:MAG: hypothetical protein IK125_04540 [Lachnospiraceae bacterium]|nr:hypothetical protein [Lachnospiraceae bacterium]
MTGFWKMFRLEMRSLWLPMIVWIVVMTTAWFLVPTYMIWAIVCYVFALGGVVMKWWQCRRDYMNKNYAVLYSLPINRNRFLAARYLAGAASGFIIYGAALTVMNVFDRYDLAHLNRGPLEELAAYDEPSNYLMQYCTNRSGMMGLDPGLILRVFLGLAFFSLCVELFHISKDKYPIVFLIYAVSNLLVRFMMIRLIEGTPVMMFLIQPLPWVVTLLYYGINTAIGVRALRHFYTGHQGRAELFTFDAGASSI